MTGSAVGPRLLHAVFAPGNVLPVTLGPAQETIQTVEGNNSTALACLCRLSVKKMFASRGRESQAVRVLIDGFILIRQNKQVVIRLYEMRGQIKVFQNNPYILLSTQHSSNTEQAERFHGQGGYGAATRHRVHG
jgi:hypothetical protein